MIQSVIAEQSDRPGSSWMPLHHPEVFLCAWHYHSQLTISASEDFCIIKIHWVWCLFDCVWHKDTHCGRRTWSIECVYQELGFKRLRIEVLQWATEWEAESTSTQSYNPPSTLCQMQTCLRLPSWAAPGWIIHLCQGVRSQISPFCQQWAVALMGGEEEAAGSHDGPPLPEFWLPPTTSTWRER